MVEVADEVGTVPCEESEEALRQIDEKLVLVEEEINKRQQSLQEVDKRIEKQAVGASSSAGRLRLHSVAEFPTDDGVINDGTEVCHVDLRRRTSEDELEQPWGSHSPGDMGHIEPSSHTPVVYSEENEVRSPQRPVQLEGPAAGPAPVYASSSDHCTGHVQPMGATPTPAPAPVVLTSMAPSPASPRGWMAIKADLAGSRNRVRSTGTAMPHPSQVPARRPSPSAGAGVGRHTIGSIPACAFVEIPGLAGGMATARHQWHPIEASRCGSPVTPRTESHGPEACRSATPLGMGIHARLVASSSSSSTPHVSSPRGPMRRDAGILRYATPSALPYPAACPTRVASAAAPPGASENVSPSTGPRSVSAGRLPCRVTAPGTHSPAMHSPRFAQIAPQLPGTATPQVVPAAYRTASPGMAASAAMTASASLGRSSSRGTATVAKPLWAAAGPANAPNENGSRFCPASPVPPGVCGGRFVPVAVPEGVTTHQARFTPTAAPSSSSSRYAHAGTSIMRDYQPNLREARRRGRG